MTGKLGVSTLCRLSGRWKGKDDGMVEDVRPSKDYGTMEA